MVRLFLITQRRGELSAYLQLPIFLSFVSEIRFFGLDLSITSFYPQSVSSRFIPWERKTSPIAPSDKGTPSSLFLTSSLGTERHFFVINLPLPHLPLVERKPGSRLILLDPYGFWVLFWWWFFVLGVCLFFFFLFLFFLCCLFVVVSFFVVVGFGGCLLGGGLWVGGLFSIFGFFFFLR